MRPLPHYGTFRLTDGTPLRLKKACAAAAIINFSPLALGETIVFDWLPPMKTEPIPKSRIKA